MFNSQERIFGYDLLKTLAIFLIVFYHLGGLDFGTIVPGKYYFPNVNKIITTFCAAGVPLFLMVNGALVVHKKHHWKQMLFKALHLLFLLVFWKLVLQYLIASLLLDIKDNMVHFWFLGTLSIVYIVSIILQQYNLLRSFVLILLLFFPFLYNLFWDFYLFFFPTIKSVKITHTGFFTMYAILYYYCGDFFRNHQISLLYSLGLVLLGLLLVNFEVMVRSNHYLEIYDGVNSSFPTFGALALSMGIFMYIKNITINDCLFCKFVTFVGRNTLGIYLFHVLIIYMLRKFCPDLISFNTPFFALLISIAIIISTAYISNVVNRCKAAFLLNLSYKL